MAFGGVDTGSINPQLAPNVAPIAGGTGLTPAAIERDIITGTTMLAEAVFDVASLTRIDMKIAAKVMPQTEVAPLKVRRPLPTASASFVSNMRLPRLIPPPKRSRVPQSIFVACFQDMVNSRSFQFTGSIKRRPAPIRAATASGIRSL